MHRHPHAERRRPRATARRPTLAEPPTPPATASDARLNAATTLSPSPCSTGRTPPCRLDRLVEQLVVACDRRRHRLRCCLPPLSRSLHIGQQERDRARRQRERPRLALDHPRLHQQRPTHSHDAHHRPCHQRRPIVRREDPPNGGPRPPATLEEDTGIRSQLQNVDRRMSAASSRTPRCRSADRAMYTTLQRSTIDDVTTSQHPQTSHDRPLVPATVACGATPHLRRQHRGSDARLVVEPGLGRRPHARRTTRPRRRVDSRHRSTTTHTVPVAIGATMSAGGYDLATHAPCRTPGNVRLLRLRWSLLRLPASQPNVLRERTEERFGVSKRWICRILGHKYVRTPSAGSGGEGRDLRCQRCGRGKDSFTSGPGAAAGFG